MNQNIFLKSFVSLFIVFLVFSCSKNNEQVNTDKKNSYQPTEKELQIESRILAFKEKVDFARANPGLKSGGEDLSVDDAVWSIEALVNYTYADASEQFDKLVNNHDSVTVNLTNGMITIDDATDAYDEIVSIISGHYNNLPSQDKQLIIADVSLRESDGVTAIFNVSSGIGDGPPNPFAGFGENDHWYFGFGDLNAGGYCDGPYQGTHTDSDAAEEIEKKINMRMSLPVGHRCFTNIKSVYAGGDELYLIYEKDTPEEIWCECCDIENPNDPTPHDNYLDFLVFFNYEQWQNFHGCLHSIHPNYPDEMNFYLNSMEDIIYEMAYECFPDQLEGKIFSRCNMYWGYYPYIGSASRWHYNTIYYGESVGGDPPH